MKNPFVFVCLLVVTLLLQPGLARADCMPWLNYSAPKLHVNEQVDFCAFEGKVVLAVNTASRCGFTPQFKGLEALYQKYRDQGLVIVGFPSDDFRQEFSDSQKTADVCYLNYGVSFPMLEESSVKGDSANGFFSWLVSVTGSSPKWNFTKYLISRDGEKVTHFGTLSKPVGGKLEKAVIRALSDG